MNLINVDINKCVKCGNCAGECPMHIIGLNPTPIVRPGMNKACIFCGHCEAVCPSGALSLKYFKNVSACTATKTKLTDEEIGFYIRNRRSIRRFKTNEADQETLEKVIDIARFAPTGGNRQYVNWMVVSKAEEIKKLSAHVIDYFKDLLEKSPTHPFASYIPYLVQAWEKGIDPICHNAPHIVIAYAPADYPVALTDCTIALSYFDLALPAFGLGGCWCGFFYMAANSWEPLQKALDLPQGNKCFGSMLVGYPQYTYYRIPKRNVANIIWK